MIPVKLKLRNFMCYRDNVPVLSFEGIHATGICGDNGSGKSALIDAMTWALWGKTRAKSDDALVYAGETDMEVEFEFTLGEQLYRIIRKHTRPKKRGLSGKTILEFQIAANGGFRPLSGDTQRQTQQKIIDVLRMDYDTFINSAFLRQGHADEFTIKRPVERKQVLAEILGLSFYDELEARAREMVRQQEMEKVRLGGDIEDIINELQHKPAYEVELERAQEVLAQLDNKLSGQEARLNEVRRDKEALAAKQSQLAQLESHITGVEKAVGRWAEQIQQHQARLGEYESLLAQRDAIEAAYRQLAEAKKQAGSLDQKLRLVTGLNQRKHKLEMSITRAGEVLLQDHAVVQSRILELEKGYQQLPRLKADLQQAQLRNLAELEEALRAKVQAGRELQAKAHYLESSQAQLALGIQEAEEKLHLLATESGVTCPLCETELGADGRERIESKYILDKDGKADLLKSAQAELAQVKSELASLESEVRQQDKELTQQRAAAQGQVSVLHRDIAEAEKAGRQLAEYRSGLVDIEQKLARKDFAAGEQAALRAVEAELAGIDYDPARHEQSLRRLNELEQYEAPQRKLEEADRSIAQEKDALSRAEAAHQELVQALGIDNQSRAAMQAELSRLPWLVSDLAEIETAYQALVSRRKQAGEDLWRAQAKLEHCAELEAKQNTVAKALSRAAQQEQIYRDLSEAFGKRGIPALLIEMALPEIEAEANRLLGRMTANRMHVKIETQRESKKGDLLETLDINIADELGTRSYEMFSGGEAFRINFAIRIALSKLLVRRAGAPLPTLIIDEGFGTQDSSGVERLKEAINSIQDDFEKILVITHIEELKEAFPARIDVIKTVAGSTLEVN